MNTPHPTAEAVDLFARAQYDYVSERGGGARWTDGTAVAWDDLPAGAKPRQQEMSLELLLVAYPQIVADVLNHYADVAESPAAAPWIGRFNSAKWLRAQAVEVLS